MTKLDTGFTRQKLGNFFLVRCDHCHQAKTCADQDVCREWEKQHVKSCPAVGLHVLKIMRVAA